tara:strand:+ start:228 stop:980 length:753 start_codon:yes stop_codon:yes gene_type:complete
MNKNNNINEFSKKGYCVVDIDKKYIKELEKLNLSILNNITKKIGKNNYELSDFHKLKLSDIELNNFRLETIKLINSKKNLRRIIYDSLGGFLDKCLGPDVVVQKNINLVIQSPKDKNRSPFHKDAPMASNYELVVWLPLVDCVKTMSMYLFDLKHHNQAKKLIMKNTSEKKFKDFSKKNGKLLNVKFGQAMIFWTNNFHYIPVNEEKRTRWSLNLRYKNLFTKYGTKNLLDYYDILKLSPITELLNKIDV